MVLIKTGLAFTVVAAALEIVHSASRALSLFINLTSLILLCGSILTSLLINIRHPQGSWFNGRALAESIKTRAWRYITCTEPYGQELSPAEADKILVEDLKKIIWERTSIAGSMANNLTTEPQITDKMRRARTLSTKERTQLYIRDRIEEQQKWYSRKAKYNSKASSIWFFVIVVAQVLAVLSTVLNLIWITSPIETTGLFTTAASAFLAWLQVKQHQELSQSYSLASQELGLIVQEGNHITTSEELSLFVSESENAISREHTLWMARRNTV